MKGATERVVKLQASLRSPMPLSVSAATFRDFRHSTWMTIPSLGWMTRMKTYPREV